MTLVTSLYRLLSPYSNDLSLSRSGLHCRHKYYILKITFAAWWRFFSRCLALQQTSPPIRKDFCWLLVLFRVVPGTPTAPHRVVPGTPTAPEHRSATICGDIWRGAWHLARLRHKKRKTRKLRVFTILGGLYFIPLFSF